MRVPTRQNDESVELTVSLPLTIRYSALAAQGWLDILGFHGSHTIVRRFP